MELRFGDLGEACAEEQADLNTEIEFPNEWADYAKKIEQSPPTRQTHHGNREIPQKRHQIKRHPNSRGGIGGILSGLSTEDILLIALLYILYEEGADRLTLLALAYILFG